MVSIRFSVGATGSIPATSSCVAVISARVRTPCSHECGMNAPNQSRRLNTTRGINNEGSFVAPPEALAAPARHTESVGPRSEKSHVSVSSSQRWARDRPTRARQLIRDAAASPSGEPLDRARARWPRGHGRVYAALARPARSAAACSRADHLHRSRARPAIPELFANPSSSLGPGRSHG